MTNVMKAKPLAAIHERAMTFVAQCAEAGKASVDVYVNLPIVLRCDYVANSSRYCFTATQWIALLISCSVLGDSNL
jgi:hypothetical protein